MTLLPEMANSTIKSQNTGMTLYYVLDPMCSWCWGFRPVFQQLLESLPSKLEVRYVMGGLAADSSEPMPEATRQYVQTQWRAVEETTGAQFNWDFWQQCQPRRSTYPACRAVIAAGLQQTDSLPEMIHAIQQAYYLQARNPSDASTLIKLAREIGLDHAKFALDINSDIVQARLEDDFLLRQKLNVNSFPSVLVETNDTVYCLTTRGLGPDSVLGTLDKILHTTQQ